MYIYIYVYIYMYIYIYIYMYTNFYLLYLNPACPSIAQLFSPAAVEKQDSFIRHFSKFWKDVMHCQGAKATLTQIALGWKWKKETLSNQWECKNMQEYATTRKNTRRTNSHHVFAKLHGLKSWHQSTPWAGPRVIKLFSMDDRNCDNEMHKDDPRTTAKIQPDKRPALATTKD